MTNQVNQTIAKTLKTQKPGSKEYNLASQYMHWIKQSASETERLATIKEAYNVFVRNGMMS